MFEETIAQQREAIRTLTDLVAQPSDDALKYSPAPGKWSVRAIVAHMAEDELVSSWRYRQMIERDGAALPGFDQDVWARLGDYDSWTAQEALDMYRLLREANLRMLGRLNEDQWQRHGIHAERGSMTVSDLARHMVGHDANHINQIRRLLDRR
jgi:uncharacterized damage-inducible protein DinB